jgi:hypothetical protein
MTGHVRTIDQAKVHFTKHLLPFLAAWVGRLKRDERVGSKSKQVG